MIEEGSNGGKGRVAKKTVKKILKIQRNKLMQDFEAAKFEGLGGELRSLLSILLKPRTKYKRTRDSHSLNSRIVSSPVHRYTLANNLLHSMRALVTGRAPVNLIRNLANASLACTSD